MSQDTSTWGHLRADETLPLVSQISQICSHCDSADLDEIFRRKENFGNAYPASQLLLFLKFYIPMNVVGLGGVRACQQAEL